jgi:hypothetical protein
VFHDQVEWALQWLADLGSGALLVIGGAFAFYTGIKAVERYLFLRMMRTVRISVAELRELMQSAAPPLVVDVRSAAVRRIDPRHIPGAIPVNLEDATAALPGVAPDRDVVVYCS